MGTAVPVYFTRPLWCSPEIDAYTVGVEQGLTPAVPSALGDATVAGTFLISFLPSSLGILKISLVWVSSGMPFDQ